MKLFKQIASYSFFGLCLFLAVAWSVFSIPAGLLALVASMLVLPQSFKFLKKQKYIGLFIKNQITIPLIVVILITGLAVVANSPEQLELSRLKEENEFVENQLRLENEQKQKEEKERLESAKKLEEEKIMNEKMLKEQNKKAVSNIGVVFDRNKAYLRNNNDIDVSLFRFSVNCDIMKSKCSHWKSFAPMLKIPKSEIIEINLDTLVDFETETSRFNTFSTKVSNYDLGVYGVVGGQDTQFDGFFEAKYLDE